MLQFERGAMPTGSHKFYYFDNGEKIIIEPSSNLIAVHRNLLTEEDITHATKLEGDTFLCDRRKVTRKKFDVASQNGSRFFGSEIVFLHEDNAVLIPCPEIRIEDQDPEKLDRVEVFIGMTRRKEKLKERNFCFDRTSQETMVITYDGPGLYSLTMANHFCENHNLEYCMPKFLRVLVGDK